MGCREKILETIRLEGWTEFTPIEVADAMWRRAAGYDERTIRSVMAMMCVGISSPSSKKHNDLIRVDRGRYRLRGDEQE